MKLIKYEFGSMNTINKPKKEQAKFDDYIILAKYVEIN